MINKSLRDTQIDLIRSFADSIGYPMTREEAERQYDQAEREVRELFANRSDGDA